MNFEESVVQASEELSVIFDAKDEKERYNLMEAFIIKYAQMLLMRSKIITVLRTLQYHMGDERPEVKQDILRALQILNNKPERNA